MSAVEQEDFEAVSFCHILNWPCMPYNTEFWCTLCFAVSINTLFV